MLPPVTCPRCLTEDTCELIAIHALVARGEVGRAFFDESRAVLDLRGELEHAAVDLARVRERLTLSELDIEEPFTISRPRQSDRAALAVVKHMSRFVDKKVSEAVRLGEIVERYEAGRLLTEPYDARSILAEEIGINAAEVEIRQIPRRSQLATAKQNALDTIGSEEDDGALKYMQDGLLLRSREEPAHERLDFRASKGREINRRHRDRRTVSDSMPRHLIDKGAFEVVVRAALALDDVTRPAGEMRIIVAGAEVVLDGLCARQGGWGYPSEAGNTPVG